MSRRGALYLAFFAVSIASSPLFAQTTEILATGPDRATGIPYLSPNVIPYFRVTYRATVGNAVSGAPGEAVKTGGAPAEAVKGAPDVRVLYTDTEIVSYSEWKPAPCGNLRTLSISAPPPVLYYRSPQGWSVFFSFSNTLRSPCGFVTHFIERFDYFLGITQGSATSSFPAVLTIP